MKRAAPGEQVRMGPGGEVLRARVGVLAHWRWWKAPSGSDVRHVFNRG